MNMKILLRITLFISICLAACNSEPAKTTPSKKLFANFYIRYLQPEKQVKAEANFLRGDSIKNAKALRIDGGVSFQNSGMGQRKLPNGTIRYNYENFFDYPTDFVFGFKDLNGEPQKQTLTLPPLGAFSTSEVSQSKGGKLILENDVLTNEESLVCLMSDSNEQTVSFAIEAASKGSEFVIPTEKLSKLALGSIKLYLVRKKVEKVSNPGYSYTSTIEYYSNEYNFDLLK